MVTTKATTMITRTTMDMIIGMDGEFTGSASGLLPFVVVLIDINVKYKSIFHAAPALTEYHDGCSWIP